MLVQSGKLKNKINDEQLRMLLAKVLPKKRDIKIKRR
jgi:DNA-binding TFAR19-related protein (PDSD5 family)